MKTKQFRWAALFLDSGKNGSFFFNYSQFNELWPRCSEFSIHQRLFNNWAAVRKPHPHVLDPPPVTGHKGCSPSLWLILAICQNHASLYSNWIHARIKSHVQILLAIIKKLESFFSWSQRWNLLCLVSSNCYFDVKQLIGWFVIIVFLF